MAYTVSCHFGSSYSMGHNRREEEYIKNQKHIKKGGEHESVIDHDIADFYRQEFGQAVADYNAREKHADRHIDSYLHKVRTDKKLNECYECIATVGNMGLHPEEQTCKKVLMEFLNQWQTENPNMKVIGAYYHADEEGAPHMHIDFVPVADYKRGLSHRNSYSKAIEQQDGFKTEEKKGTGQIQWQSKMRETLRGICISHGLEVTLEKGEKREHSDTEIFKAEKELEKVQSELSFEKMRYEYSVSRNRELHSRKNVLSQEVEKYQEEKDSLQSDLDRLKAERKHLQTDNAFLSAEMTQRSRAKEQLEKEIGVLRSELSEMQGTHTQLQSDIVSTQRLVDVWKKELEKQQDKAFEKLGEVQSLDSKIEESKGVLQQLDRSIYQKELDVEQLDSEILDKKTEVSKLQERITRLQEHAQKLLEPFKRILEDFKRGLNRADVYNASNEPEKAVKEVIGARDKAYHDLELPEGSQNLTYHEALQKLMDGEKVYLKDGNKIETLDRDSITFRLSLARVANGQAVAFTNGGLTDDSIKQMTKDFVKEQSEQKIEHIRRGPRRGR